MTGDIDDIPLSAEVSSPVSPSKND